MFEKIKSDTKSSMDKSIDNFIHINDWFHHHVHVTKYTVDGLTRKKQTIYEPLTSFSK